MFVRLSAAFLAAFLAATPAAAADPVRVILVGDSTLQANSGYGGALCERFSPDVTCLNMARGGRSSKSYRVEGFWDQAMKTIADKGAFKETYVFIQLGHNDGSDRPERHTELPEYKANIARYVDEARAAGATPVLITLVTDRRFKDGQLQAGLKPWADRTREVAAEKGAPLVDLYATSSAVVQAMGATEAGALAPAPAPPEVVAAAWTGNTIPWPPRPVGAARPAPSAAPAPAAANPARAATPPQPRGPGFDYVHIGRTGAPMFAAMVVDEIKKMLPRLAPYVVEAKQ